MRRHEGGAGCGTSGRDSHSRPGAAPGSNPDRLLRAGSVRDPSNAKAGKAAWRADWRVLQVQRLLGAPHPSHLRGWKRDGPSPARPK